MDKSALITGIAGQDGSYLAEYLLELGYKVYGVLRRVQTARLYNISHIIPRITLLEGDITDSQFVDLIFAKVHFDEVYNMAAQSFVPYSWSSPDLTFHTNTIGLLNIISAILKFKKKHSTRIYQASSSEMYGNSYPDFMPLSPYGLSKLSAHYLAGIYRRADGLFISCGICFNHESPRRGDEFVTKKIVNHVKARDRITLGNLEAYRDWGFAGDFVKAMHLLLQQPKPMDVEIATGETHSVREFVKYAYSCAGLNYADYVIVDDSLKRPNEVEYLKGNPFQIKTMGWTQSVDFQQLIEMMMAPDA